MTEDDVMTEVFTALKAIARIVGSAEDGRFEADVSVLLSRGNCTPYEIAIPPHAISSVLRVVGLEILRDFRDSERFREMCGKDLINKIDDMFSTPQKQDLN